MSQYEVEIKSLLGTRDKADTLIQNLARAGFVIDSPKRSTQLNHYFTYSDLEMFLETTLPYVPEEKKDLFVKTIKEGSNFSIRTRQSNDKVLLVVKASLGDDSSSNGVARMEFEIEMPMTLVELDQILLDSGLQYQAKWSRQREEYEGEGITVCLDKNAGYGYLAEFEKVVDDQALVQETKESLLSFMERMGTEELPQGRLERMFAHYNTHWPEYYGTDNTFTVE
ncbi:MAG: CYTH domain-containing protein [Candidatus Paceibacterota bacterium]